MSDLCTAGAYDGSGCTQRAEECLKSEGKHNYFDQNVAMVQGNYENVKHHIQVLNMVPVRAEPNLNRFRINGK